MGDGPVSPPHTQGHIRCSGGSAPQPPPFHPHLGPTQIHICLGLFQAPPSVTNMQAEPSSSLSDLHPVGIRSTTLACIPGSTSSLNLRTPYALFLPAHMPLSLCSGSGHLGFSSFIPAMGHAAVEPRAENPVWESNSGLLCPGTCWRVHKTLPGSRCQGAVGLARGDVLGTRHVLLPAVGSGLGVSLMERPA